MKTKIAKFFYLILVVVFLGSCAAINVTSSSLKEKGIKEAMSDGMIDATVNKEFINHDINMFINVEIEVVEGRVLLTGSVKKTKHRLDAIKLAWKALGVREVINEIQVDRGSTVTDYAHDMWITTQLKYKLTFDKNILAINYAVETVNRTIYLIGIAQNQQELEQVVAHANNINRVINVVSHVRIKKKAFEKS